MISINFNKVGSVYIAEAYIANAFTLRVEREQRGTFFVKQRATASGDYLDRPDYDFNAHLAPVVELDIEVGKFPKYFQFVSHTPVKRAWLHQPEHVIADTTTNEPLINAARALGWIASTASVITEADAAKVTKLVPHWWYQFDDVVIGDETQGAVWFAYDDEGDEVICEPIDGYLFKGEDGTIYPEERMYVRYGGGAYYLDDSDDWSFGEEHNEFVINEVETLDLSAFTAMTSIGSYAFNSCTSLASVVIPDSVTSIGSYAFNSCTSLASVVIPDSVTNIEERAFNSCTSLASVVIPDSVTSIGSYAFYGCTSLASVVIPDSVTSIGYYAFYGCTSLASVVIPDSVTSIEESAFSGCTSLASVVIPDSVTSIEESAFSGCTSLASVVIPDSVTSIGYYAFYGCTSLDSVTCYATTPPALGGSAFSNNKNTRKIYVPSSSVGAYKAATNWVNYETFIYATPTNDGYRPQPVRPAN